MCFGINYMLEWEPLIQEGEVHSRVIRLGKKQLFCGNDTSQVIVNAQHAAPPASLADAGGWAAWMSQTTLHWWIPRECHDWEAHAGWHKSALHYSTVVSGLIHVWLSARLFSLWFVKIPLASSNLKVVQLFGCHFLELQLHQVSPVTLNGNGKLWISYSKQGQRKRT